MNLLPPPLFLQETLTCVTGRNAQAALTDGVENAVWRGNARRTSKQKNRNHFPYRGNPKISDRDKSSAPCPPPPYTNPFPFVGNPYRLDWKKSPATLRDGVEVIVGRSSTQPVRAEDHGVAVRVQTQRGY